MDPRYTIQIQYEEGGEFIPHNNIDSLNDLLWLLFTHFDNPDFYSLRVIDHQKHRQVLVDPSYF